jgi:hypothetical protein
MVTYSLWPLSWRISLAYKTFHILIETPRLDEAISEPSGEMDKLVISYSCPANSLTMVPVSQSHIFILWSAVVPSIETPPEIRYFPF